MTVTVIHGDCRESLMSLPEGSFHCCVTSPPYFGLRSYLPEDHPMKAREIGLEPTPEAFVQALVEVFREVRRVLRDDGVLWLNIGDSYAGGGRGGGGSFMAERGDKSWKSRAAVTGWRAPPPGLKSKNLIGIPWRLALALQADGWWLRSECIWAKPNPQPEAVTDRPARAHEHVFLLSKSEHYYYDPFAVLEPVAGTAKPRGRGLGPKARPRGEIVGVKQNESFSAAVSGLVDKRNLRTIWSIATKALSEGHFATFPEELARRCVNAGTSERGCCAACGAPRRRTVESVRLRDGVPCELPPARSTSKAEPSSANGINHNRIVTSRRSTGWLDVCACGSGSVPCRVLDPFGGSGTVGRVASELGRDATLVELNEEYLDIIRRRCAQESLFARASEPS